MFNPLLQAIELLIISAMRALYEAVILRLPLSGMEVSEGRDSLQLELIELKAVSLDTLGLIAPILYSPIGLSLQDPGGRGRWSPRREHHGSPDGRICTLGSSKKPFWYSGKRRR